MLGFVRPGILFRKTACSHVETQRVPNLCNAELNLWFKILGKVLEGRENSIVRSRLLE